jgi:hypothetical protein
MISQMVGGFRTDQAAAYDDYIVVRINLTA